MLGFRFYSVIQNEPFLRQVSTELELQKKDNSNFIFCIEWIGKTEQKFLLNPRTKRY